MITTVSLLTAEVEHHRELAESAFRRQRVRREAAAARAAARAERRRPSRLRPATG